ncbi:MAG TPA: phosphoglycerate kinase, partial [Thermoanaerobaculia bacterium]|nr:phosphoglycerate kinase [Thermoanaerobaculia bacterium]
MGHDRAGGEASDHAASDEKRAEVVLPVDVVAAIGLEVPRGEAVGVDKIPEGMMALDIGPETARLFADRIGRARTVFWNGPMGVFEKAPFAKGTMGVAEAVAGVQGTTVIGGGDSVAAVNKAGVASKIT